MSPPNQPRQAVAHLTGRGKPESKPDLETLMETVDKTQKEVEQLSASVTELKESVDTLTKSTADMVEMFEAGRGAFKVLGWIGTFAKWASVVAAGTAAFWAFFTHGNMPPK